MDIAKLSIDRPKFITMVTLFLVVVGVLALRKIPVDLYPSVSYPVLVVRAQFPGAAPEEVEQLITKKMEDSLSTISGINTLRSVSREGIAIVQMEFNPGVDVRFQEIQVRGKIANLRASLPDNLKEPEIFRQDPDDVPIIEIAVSGARSSSEMSQIADDVIARRLRQLPSVGQVDLVGNRTPEIQINLNPEAIDAWHVNPKDVVSAIKNMNRNDPAGTVKGHDRVWLLRSLSQSRTPHDLGLIPVTKTTQGQPILLEDLAEITSGFSEISKVSRFGDASGLKPAVLLNVLKQSGENTVEVSDRVRTSLTEMAKVLPPDVHATITRDNADLVRENVADVYESLALGALLTVIVVLVFLRSPRSTLTTGLSLPSSVITAFAVMAIAGFTVNVMTLLALSLAIGLLVDDAIVVRENIFRHLHLRDSKSAALKGTKEVQLAVIATTLTIVAVFLPVGFMGGVSGQFFKQFALTVVFAVLVSLYDAMTMAPMLSAYFANIANPSDEWRQFGRFGLWCDRMLIAFEHSFDRVSTFYGRLLSKLIRRPIIATVIALLAVAGAFVGFSFVKKSFLPAQLGKVFTVSLQGPIAIPIERVLEVSNIADGRIGKLPGIANWTVSSGLSYTGNASVEFTVRVKDEVAKNQDQLAGVRSDIRKTLQGIPGYSVRVSEPADPLSGSTGRFQPLAVVVSGDDIGTLQQIGRKAREIMASVEGVTDIAQIQVEGLPEFQVRTDPLLAGPLGVNATQVGEALSTWVIGDASNSIAVGQDQVPIRVRLKDGDRQSPLELLSKNIFVRPQGAKSDVGVSLRAISTTSTGAGSSLINRENRQRILRVGANLAPGAALGDIVSELNGKLRDLPLPDGYRVRIAGQNEQMNELFTNVVWAIGLGSIFVYMILVSLFESFTQPISVMAAIPLAATGAVAGLLLFNKPLDLYAGVGMILLAGIVAKNSILLVDFAMQRVRDHQVDPTAAILEAAPLRLRPIVMTSVAMIAGMIPVAAGLGAGGGARQGLGIATIGGVISSTLLTLLVVPNLYVAIEKVKDRFKEKLSKKM
ncbi:MAG: efflux RND transporter permease subunit [Pseudomonadota bacterium]